MPVPPMSEQRRVADLLDKADAIRRKRKHAIALTDDLLRSTFLDMFGDPVTNPKRWELGEVRSLLSDIEAGWSANGEARPRENGELGVLKVSAVTSGWFRPDEHKAVPAMEIDRPLVAPRRGDLLFSRANTREHVAAVCLVDVDVPGLFLPDKLWRLTPDSQRATSEFLRYLLGHGRLRQELTKTATGTSGSMLNVSMEKLQSLLVPIPPRKLQLVYSEIVRASLGARADQVLAASAAHALSASLVQSSFGER